MGKKSSQKKARRQELQTKEATPVTPLPGGPFAFQGTLFHTSHLRAGPLPDPEELAAYQQIIPDMPQVLLDAYVKQGDHRRRLEGRVITHNIIQSYLGLLIGGAIGGLGVWGAIQVMLAGYQLAGGAGLFLSLGSLVGVFVYGKQRQTGELVEKNKKS